MFPYYTGTTYILVHIPTLIYSPDIWTSSQSVMVSGCFQGYNIGFNVTLSESCSQNQTTRNLLLKRDTVPHRQDKEQINNMWGHLKQANWIRFLNLILIKWLFLNTPLTGGKGLGAIDYLICFIIIKYNRLIIYLSFFTLILAILSVKPPRTITIITRNTPFVLIFVAGHGGCCQIFHIGNNRILRDPFWKISH